MTVAIGVIKSNIGVFLVAFFLQLVATIWSIALVVACTWAQYVYGFKIIVLFVISYLWVEQVLKNVMHVTMAGVVGKWWLIPGDRPSGALGLSLERAITTSFGSICFGSLFVNYFYGLRNLVAYASEKRLLKKWICPVEVTSCLFESAHSVVLYMNKWAFVYVGLYGYTFFEAGKFVTILLDGKGLKKLVTDDLVDNIVFILNLAIACLTGFAGCFLSSSDNHYATMLDIYNHPYFGPIAAGFSIGFLSGYLVSAVLLGVVGGAVNTIIVCFAENPIQFRINHERHSNALHGHWSFQK
eukprot:CAMPEP_0181126538 /NCGR_PEP_ID=MMETSP1071-20121207/27692_1 /TAXON_ID=35127 /ORGANISM="Thalassiosira sp., Strain NH16" /LENGTH=297 /DNA_ID=CAMNT_0023212165 /DNA_START=132 /DNA_END=1025 /DNA_ORIENTATION=+